MGKYNFSSQRLAELESRLLALEQANKMNFAKKTHNFAKKKHLQKADVYSRKLKGNDD